MSNNFDAADVVSALVSLAAPCRKVDKLFHELLGGRQPRREASVATIRLGSWLADETPAYTDNVRQVSVAARRLGIRVDTEIAGRGWRGTATDASGSVRHAFARTEGAAAAAALLSVVFVPVAAAA